MDQPKKNTEPLKGGCFQHDQRVVGIIARLQQLIKKSLITFIEDAFCWELNTTQTVVLLTVLTEVKPGRFNSSLFGEEATSDGLLKSPSPAWRHYQVGRRLSLSLVYSNYIFHR